MALCILSAGLVTRLAVTGFTLLWTHSVEKVIWAEDYLVSPAGLRLVEARIQGSGAGMEVPDGAVLRDDGFWHYRPDLPLLPELVLANSGAVADWRLCVEEDCRGLGSLLPEPGPVFVLRPCEETAPGLSPPAAAR